MILTTADVVDSVAKEMRNRQNGSHATNNNNRNNRKRNKSLISNDEGVPDLEIIGPEGTKSFLHSLRHFMRRDRFKVHAHEGQYDSSLNNNKASASFTAKKKAKKKKFKGSVETDEIGFNVKSIPISYDASHANDETYDERDLSTAALLITKQAVSYLFATPPIPGKFLIEKAQALNVPRGPMYAQLKKGESVTFVDPDTKEVRTIKSEEVVEKSSPGVGVAVVYCPTLKVLNELKQSKTFGTFGTCLEER